MKRDKRLGKIKVHRRTHWICERETIRPDREDEVTMGHYTPGTHPPKIVLNAEETKAFPKLVENLFHELFHAAWGETRRAGMKTEEAHAQVFGKMMKDNFGTIFGILRRRYKRKWN